MDCKSAHLLLTLDRPWASELDAAEAEALREHLAGCPACAAQAERGRRGDDQLGRAVREVPVPEGLRGRLLDHLGAARAVRLRRRVWRVAAVAAALLLAVAVGWYVRLSLRPGVDAEQIAREFERRAYAPDKVEEWFLDQRGVVMVAPTQLNDAPLNYGLLISYEMGEFQGVRVPELVFLHQGPNASLARVYVLSDRSFNLDDATLPTRAAGSTFRVEVVRPPDNPHFLFVILYTGDSLTPFFTTHPSGA